jgi:hypothetical protein
MQDTRTGYPSFEGRAYALPTGTTALTAAAKHRPPQVAQPITEATKRPAVFGNRMVSVIATDHTLQPCTHLIDRLVHPLTQLHLDGMKRRPHPLGNGLTAYGEMGDAGRCGTGRCGTGRCGEMRRRCGGDAGQTKQPRKGGASVGDYFVCPGSSVPDRPGSSYLEVLDGQRSLYTEELTLAGARGSEYQSLVELYRALGGGWQ